MKNIDTASSYFFQTIYENLLDRKKRVILSNNNILYSTSDTNEFNFFDFYDLYYKDHYFDKLTTPHLICTGAFTMPYLEDILYDNETINYLNTHGLEIYLFEILHFDFGKKKKCLIDLFGDHTTEISYNELKLNFDLTQENIDELYSFELESIQKFVENNRLTLVTVYTNENNTETILQNKYKNLKIKTKDILCKGYRQTVKSNVLNKETIKNHFWCGNWRYDVHRHLVASVMSYYNTTLSFTHTVSMSQLTKKLWFDLDSWKKYPLIYNKIIHGVDYLYQHTPIFIDKLPLCPHRKTVLSCPSGYPLPEESYTQSFCAVVTETKFAHPFPCFSEKTINAITCGRPFILVAPAHTLKYLKSLGVKTFNTWWSEEYDSIENHEERLLAIFNVIEKISQMSISDLKNTYKSMIPTIKHNLQWLDTIKE